MKWEAYIKLTRKTPPFVLLTHNKAKCVYW